MTRHFVIPTVIEARKQPAMSSPAPRPPPAGAAGGGLRQEGQKLTPEPTRRKVATR
jgi:hypothetical protein